MQFFLSEDVTLSTKLLEIIYIFMGFLCIYTSFKNLLTKTKPNRIGTFIFWFLLGIVMAFGRWLPDAYSGALIVALTIPPIIKKVDTSKLFSSSEEKTAEYAKKIGYKLFLPALSIGVFAIIFALQGLGALVGIGAGVLVAVIILMFLSKENTPKVFLDEASNSLSVLGPLSLMPILLSSLGSVFEKAGVGQVISDIVGSFIPEGNVTVGIIIFALGMVIFTMIMGNAFAAITVMLVGIAGPFVLKYGANPVIIGMIGLTAGYCGTLLTPMAANFNVLPIAMLDMKNRMGVIKNQIIPAFILLIFQIFYMIFFS